MFTGWARGRRRATDSGMSGDNPDKRDAIRRHVRQAAIAGAIGHAAWSGVLLYGIYAEPKVLKIGAFFVIGWLPVGILMTYAEMDQTWGPDTEIWASTGAALLIGGLTFLAWYLS